MAINLQQISNITKEACAALKGKTFGGVTKESAMEAIEQTARKVAEAAEEAIGRVQQEIQALRGKTAREIADITSQKDAFCHQVQEQAAQKVAQVQGEAAEAAAALKQAKAVKTAQKVLPNGHVQVRKVNKNGAVMVKEYNEQGQLLHSSVTTLDGSIRRTTYNPIDGKPVKTFTNASGKDMLIEYPANGKTKTTQVNNKKVNPKQKPALVSQTKPELINGGTAGKIEKVYSDGSKEVLIKTFENGRNKESLQILKYDNNGKLVSEKITKETVLGETVLERKITGDGEIVTGKFIFEGKKFKITEYVPKDDKRMPSIRNNRKYNIDKFKFEQKPVYDEFGQYKGVSLKTKYPDGKVETEFVGTDAGSGAYLILSKMGIKYADDRWYKVADMLYSPKSLF